MNSERNWSEVRREVAFGERSLHGESKKEEGRSKLPFNRLVDDFNDACDRVCLPESNDPINRRSGGTTGAFLRHPQ
jgi:hypothetical protein